MTAECREAVRQRCPRCRAAVALPPPLLFGLDLGQAQDYSALAVAEQAPGAGAGGRRRYHVRHLHRWPLGTPYTAKPPQRGIVEDVAVLITRAPAPVTLVLDATGCGRPVVDIFRRAQLNVALNAVLITAGHAANFGADGSWHVPKIDLVGAVAACLEGRRLLIAPTLRLAAVLAQELMTFRVKVTAAGNETFESWRERDHDDLVLAVALAVWLGESAGDFQASRATIPNPDLRVRLNPRAWDEAGQSCRHLIDPRRNRRPGG
jgi:hypothetical protein